MAKGFFVFTDGGARGNPGPAAIGFFIQDESGKILAEEGQRIGRATNNVAEYQAVIEAFKWLKKNYSTDKPSSCQFFLDSKLVVNQLNGLFKVKNARLKVLNLEVKKIEQAIGVPVTYRFIPREKNQRADALVNQSF